jgi:hypothetical protein
MNWSGLEPEPGRWRWDHMDSLIDTHHVNNLMVLGVFGAPPRRASTVPEGYRAWNSLNFTVNDVSGWTNYCARMAGRYKGRVDHWEFWNEPFWPKFLIAGVTNGTYIHGDAGEFVDLCRATRKAVRGVNPDAALIWNAGSLDNPDFDRACVSNGIYEVSDLVTYHLYTSTGVGSDGDMVERKTDMVREIRPEQYNTMPIWNSEGGPGGVEVHNAYRHIPPANMRARGHVWSDYLIRYYLRSIANGVDKFFFYTYHGKGEWERDYVLTNPDGTLNAHACALSNLAWHLEGRHLQGRFALAEGVDVYLFDDDQTSVAVVSGDARNTLLLERDMGILQIRDMYGNDVTFPRDLGGQPTFITSSAPADALAEILLTLP